MANILVVENEPKVPGAIKEGLEQEGHEIFLAQTGEDSSSGNLLDRPVRFCFCFSRFPGSA
jgi:DNA-binding response OmpR family regulator